jgi:hypothetical protein
MLGSTFYSTPSMQFSLRCTAGSLVKEHPRHLTYIAETDVKYSEYMTRTLLQEPEHHKSAHYFLHGSSLLARG